MGHRIISITKPKHVTKHEPCPICGKEDWCFSSISTYEFDEGQNEDFEFVGCNRFFSDEVSGIDGIQYTYERSSKEGVNIYEEVSQRQHRHKRVGKKEFGEKPLNNTYVRKVAKKRKMLCENKVASVERRDEVYRALLSMLKLEDYHKRYLGNEGWDVSLLNFSNFRSLPPSGYQVSQLIKKKKANETLTDFEKISLNLGNPTRKKFAQQLYMKFGDLTGIPGFYLKNNNYDNTQYWDFSGQQGILMPQYDVKGRIFQLRIRLDEAGDSNKYRSISSYYEKVIDENENEKIYDNPMKNGSAADLGISYIFTKRDSKYLFMTEGEKKQAVVSHEKDVSCANIPGVSSFAKILNDVDDLKARGIETVVIAYDADKQSNLNVLMAEIDAIDLLQKQGFGVIVASWPEEDGKGIDDVTLSGKDINYQSLNDYLQSVSERMGKKNN